jgi:hypothetical protein
MSNLVFDAGAWDRAERALYHAKKTWNQLLSGCGGVGAKFSYRLRRFMDEAQSWGVSAQLVCEAMRLRIRELNRTGKSALEYWE